MIVACASDDDSATGSPSSTSVRESQSTSTSAAGAALNPLQGKVIDALSKLELRGSVAELSLSSAQIVVNLADGRELHVSGTPLETHGGEFIVKGERVVNGVPVKTVEYPSAQATREQFACNNVVYEASGAIPPNFATFEVFLSELLDALDC